MVASLSTCVSFSQPSLKMGSALLTLLLIVSGIAGFVDASQSIISGGELRDAIILLEKLVPEECKLDVYAIVQINGINHRVKCDINKDTYISDLIIGDKFKAEESKLFLTDHSSERKLYSSRLERFLQPEETYELYGSPHRFKFEKFDKFPFLFIQTGGLETIYPVLDSIASLLTDFCKCPSPETMPRKSLTEEKIRIVIKWVNVPLVIRCQANLVEVHDHGTNLFKEDLSAVNLQYDLVDKDSNLHAENTMQSWKIRQLEIADPNQIELEVDYIDIEKILIPVNIFKEDLQELWEDISGYRARERKEAQMEEIYLTGRIRYGKKTFINVEKTGEDDVLLNRDFIHLDRDFNKDGMTVPTIFFADQKLRNKAVEEVNEDDGFFMEGLLSGEATSDITVQYGIFFEFWAVLSKHAIIAAMTKEISGDSFPITVRFIFEDHAIDGKFNGKDAFSFTDLVVLQGFERADKNYAYAKKTKYNLAIFHDEMFMTKDGDLKSAFAVRLQRLQEMCPYAEFIEKRVEGVEGWKVRVIKDGL